MLAVQCMHGVFCFFFICSLAESLDISAKLYNEFVLHLKSSNDQFQYQECIFSFIIGLVYYGWAVANAHSAKLDPYPSDDILQRINGFCVCKGCDAESSHQLIPHVITKSAKPFSEGESAVFSSTILAYR